MNSSIIEDYAEFDGVSDSFQAYGELIVQKQENQSIQKIEYQNFSEVDPSFKIELSRKQSFTTNTQTPALGQSFCQKQDKFKDLKQKLNVKELNDKLMDQKQRKRSVSSENYLHQTRVFYYEKAKIIQKNYVKSYNIHNRDQIETNISFLQKIRSIKEGYVEKKGDFFLLGWQKRFLILYDTKLIYLKSTTKRHIIQGWLVSKDKLIENIIFEINLEGFNYTFQFKSSEAKNWMLAIEAQIQKIDQYRIFLPRIKQNFLKIYFKKDIISEIEFQYQCGTGDILLIKSINQGFQFTDTFSIQFIIVRMKQKIFLCTYNMILNIQAILLWDYENFIQQCQNQIEQMFLKQLNYLKSGKIQEYFDNNFVKTEGNNYINKESQMKKHRKKKSRSKYFEFNNEDLIVDLYKIFEIVDPKHSSSDFQISKIKDPVIHTINGAWLSHMIQIFPNRHLEGNKSFSDA